MHWNKPDRTTAYCLGQAVSAVLVLLFVIAAIFVIGFYFYLRRLP
jgi:hypothetical protein